MPDNTEYTTGTLFDMLNPNHLVNNAQKVINSAVNVLEEEIAAGILAAKRIERRAFGDTTFNNDPANLANRIRKDVHEALDIFLDAFVALSKQMGVLTDTVTKENEKYAATAAPAKKTKPALQVIEYDKPVAPGEKITIPVLLGDDAITAPVTLTLQKTGFTGPGANNILSRFVKVSPATIQLNPGKEQQVNIQVTVPRNCGPGQYNSLLTIPQMPAAKIVLSIEVKQIQHA